MSVKISELPSLETLADNDILAGVDTSEDTTSKITLEKIKDYTTEDVYDKEEVDNTIDALQTQIDSLSTIYNAFPTASDEGESMTLDDTAEVTFKKLDLKGNTSQVSYSGIQLFDIETIPSSSRQYKRNNGFILTKGTNRTIQFNLPNSIPAGTYTLSVKVVSSTLSSNANFAINFNGSGSVVLGNFQVLNNSTFTITNPVDNLYFFISNSESDGVTITIDDIMLETGSTAHDFEPYTGGAPAPNPEYPQDIHVVSGDNTIDICGKNLMEFDNSNNPERSNYTYTSETPELVVCTKNASGNGFYAQFIAYLENGQTYTLSVEDNTNKNIYMYSDRLWGTGISGLTNKNSRKEAPLTFTSPYTGKVIIGFFGGGSQTLTQPMLVKGTTAPTTYEPYIGNSYPIPLGNIELCKIGTYQDYIYKDNGNWYLHKEINKVVLDGSETWYKSGATTGDRFYFNLYQGLLSGDYSHTIYCNKFFYKFNVSDLYAMWLDVYTTIERLFVNFSSYGTTNVTQFKEWLSNEKPIVYLRLLEPTNTLIEDTTLIEQLEALKLATSYESQTNISQENNDKPFILDVEAIKKLS